ncbi:MAG: C1 family peptidase [Nibricoccus sp.]
MKPKRALSAKIGCFAFSLLFLAMVSFLRAEDVPAKLVAGAKLPSLTVGATTYQNVTIRSVSARNAMITHDGGMKSLLLRDLSPELQQRFGYNPEAERAQEARISAGQAAAEQKQKDRIAAARNNQRSGAKGKIDQLISLFGTQPTLETSVDFRPKMSDYGLWVKDQGARPSCSVFAILSAIEFQNAELTGKPQRFSEQYLIWATANTIGLTALNQKYNLDDPTGGDIGFTLPDVVTAVRRYGILTQDRMPYRKGGPIENPSDELIKEAQTSKRVVIQSIPSLDRVSMIANIVHALNSGYPVPIGIRWVKGRHTWRSGHLDKQTPDEDSAHAVTIVGYKCETGKIEDTVFVFKNSWGLDWGVNGYGTATYYFLSQNLFLGVVLDISDN